MTPDQAETVALQALAWLAGNDELMPIFLGSSGASLEELGRQAGDPAFLGAVLDFVLMDDAWVVNFCDTAGIGYNLPMQARAVLPGGEAMNWT